MKLAIALFLLSAGVAAADPVALDYRAVGDDCIDAGRFADEVSAKLGFVPWSATAAATVRVRIEREGNRFTGTLRNTDGTAKIVDGTTCAEVIANLVMTTAVALDRSPAPEPAKVPPPAAAPAPAAAAPPSTDDVPVRFASEAGGQTAFSMRAATGFGVASDGTSIASVLLQDLCMGPCTARVPRGDHFIVALNDQFLGPTGGEQFHFDGPTTITAVPHSRRAARITLLAVGLAVAAAGAFAMANVSNPPDNLGVSQGLNTTNLALGTAGLSVGTALLIFPLFIHDSFTFRSSPGT